MREGSEGGLEQGGHEMSSFGFNRRSQIAGNEFPLCHVNFAPIVKDMMWEFYRPTFPGTLRFHSLDTMSVGVIIATRDDATTMPSRQIEKMACWE